MSNKSEKIKEHNKKLASWTDAKFKEAMIAKEPYTERWMTYYNAWNNDLFEDKSRPKYRTNHVSNFIYSSIESMRPILFDNNPKFEAIPVTPDGMQYSLDMTTLLDYEWHRTNMQEKLLANSIYTFALGTSIIFLPYVYSDNKKDKIDGEVTPIPISPFNLYPDPLATSVEDAEYIIYADYIHVGKLKAKYPEYASELQGGDVLYSELVNERDKDATINNQVLVLEVWCRDYTIIEEEEEIDEDSDEVVIKKKRKYPNGRVLITAPELGLVLEDKPNPYKSGRFPFFLFKDIDVPSQFWGEGEVKWLMSPQNEINNLYDQIIDNAKSTANMQWIVDKNSGIPKGQLSNRPGLIIRKNPGSEVRRDAPPGMPMYVAQMVDTLKMDIEVISGIHDVTRGQTPSGVQSAAAIVALQEAAQTRIRLKVRLHENALGLLGTEWINRVKQFWKFNRIVPRKVDASTQMGEFRLNGMEMQLYNDDDYYDDEYDEYDEYDEPEYGFMSKEPTHYEMVEINTDEHLKHDYRIEIIGTSVLQRNRASMLDQLTRLAQTPAEDGMPIVPREAVLDYIPDVNKRIVMQYFQKLRGEQEQKQQQQGLNNEAMQQLQMIGEQLQQLGQAVSNLQQKSDEQDRQKQQEEFMYQGYQQGMADNTLVNNQADKIGGIPAELYDELSMADNETLSVTLQQHPELLMDE